MQTKSVKNQEKERLQIAYINDKFVKYIRLRMLIIIWAAISLYEIFSSHRVTMDKFFLMGLAISAIVNIALFFIFMQSPEDIDDERKDTEKIIISLKEKLQVAKTKFQEGTAGVSVNEFNKIQTKLLKRFQEAERKLGRAEAFLEMISEE